MKKTLTLITIALLSSLSLNAQNKDTKKADQLFNRLEFNKATEAYLKLVEKGKADTYVYSQIAECYYNVFNTVEAEKWYETTLKTSEDPEMIYKYSQMLKANGKFEESNEMMRKFAAIRPGDDRATAFNKNPDYLPKILDRGKKFNVQNLDINTAASDFGGVTKNGKLYITSARNDSRKTYGWNEEPFLDIYEYTVANDGSFQGETLMGDKINTKYHEGLVAFSPDGNIMYFTRESFYEELYVKDNETRLKKGVLHLFKSSNLSDGWDDASPLHFNSETYSVKNPSVSADGKTLYFASDMPGGYGNFDIYKAAINDDGTVGEPKNLGQKVNTEGQEMFPYVSEDGSLYFSSDGHLGLGGLDVFYTKEIDGKLAPMRNVGVPVNSNADDFAFSIEESTGKGFVSSNRAGGKGSDDIYAIKKLLPICDVLISGVVTDADTGSPLSGTSVALKDTEGNVVSTKTTNGEGIAEFIVECETNSQLEVILEGYTSTQVGVEGTNEEEVIVAIALNPIEEIIVDDQVVLNPIYFDYNKSNITAQAAFELDKLVQVMLKYPEMVIKAESHTDSRGSNDYNERLSNSRAQTTVQYIISKGIDANRITGEGKGETTPKVDCESSCTEEEHQINRRSEFHIVSGNPSS